MQLPVNALFFVAYSLAALTACIFQEFFDRSYGSSLLVMTGLSAVACYLNLRVETTLETWMPFQKVEEQRERNIKEVFREGIKRKLQKASEVISNS
jgi:hypothetical protein